ncbi:MAG: hypothetical protein Q8R97_14465 [Brevundimonas sp.]|uniref:hypothetical protein n=1 Tax=Brevundimonas sp. TaxID=1871086 RepID=UPI00276A9DAF|nr:hypothetical protein [Brevundimonas sp.]MDP3402310.1 hypothetical protein [Brevundimonas sp.]MDZ4111544.1 hypothetical protein [Brevundimonas sp.]
MAASMTKRLALSVVMSTFLVSCDQMPRGDREAPDQRSAVSTDEPDGAQTEPDAPVVVDEVDPSDERLNSPGAGRDLTLAVKDDPAVMDALVGSWARSTEGCNSGEAIGFFPDGTYGLEGEGGKWVLAGDVLRFEAVTVFEMGEQGETASARDPVRISGIDATSMSWRLADGSQNKFVRCSPD